MSDKEVWEIGDGDETDLEKELCWLWLIIFKCVNILQYFYIFAADNLKERTVNSPFYFIKFVIEDVRLNGWAILDREIMQIMKAFDYFYNINRRFPTNNDLITAPDGEYPDFTKIKAPDHLITMPTIWNV